VCRVWNIWEGNFVRLGAITSDRALRSTVLRPFLGVAMALVPRKNVLAIAAVIDIALNGHNQPVAAKALCARHRLPARHLCSGGRHLRAVGIEPTNRRRRLARPLLAVLGGAFRHQKRQ